MSVRTQAIRGEASISKAIACGEHGGVTEETPAVSGPQKYLLVDDHAAFRRTIRDFLPGEPIEVIECGDSGEAVDAYSRHQPDWTLMDIEMPGVDGLQLTRSIRSRFPKARIIILTQHDSPEMREEAHAAGASNYVLKDHLKDLPGVIASLAERQVENRNSQHSS